MAKIATKSFDSQAVTIAFTNGHVIRVRYADLTDEIQAHAKGHGLAQKFGDSYAGAQTVEEAIGMCEAVVAQVMEGDWNRKGDGVSGYLPQAVAEVAGRSVEDAIAALAGLDADGKKKLAKDPRIAAVIKRLQAEAAQARADAADGGPDLGGLFG